MNKFDGISFDGKSIEDFLTTENTKEIHKISQDKYYPKQRRSNLHMETKEPHGDVHAATQTELNKANLEANLKKATTQNQKIIALLLGGGTVTSTIVAQHLNVSPSWCANLLLKLYKSALGNFINRTGDAIHGFSHKLTATGLNLTPARAFELVKAKPIKHIKKPTTHKAWAEPSEPFSFGMGAVKGMADAAEAGYRVTASEFDTAIQEAVEEVGKKLNVNISGKVEVVFRWES